MTSVFPFWPLRPPMWGGEPCRVDPEAVVATATANGGDEVRSGSIPGASQQSVADAGRMMPSEPTVKVEAKAEIVHHVNARTEAYQSTEIDVKVTAIIVYPTMVIKIQDGGYVRDELYDLDLEYLKRIVDEAKKKAVNNAAKFINKRNELYELFEKLGVKVASERVNRTGDC